MRVFASFFAIVCILLAMAGAQADIPSLLKTGTLHNIGDSVVQFCPQGQSQAIVSVGPGFTGTTAINVAPNFGTETQPSPGPTQTPISTNTPIPNAGTSLVTLGGAPYIMLTVTAATSGSATGYIRCSASVATTCAPGTINPLYCVDLDTPQPAASPFATASAQNGGYRVNGTGQLQTLIFSPNNGLTGGVFPALRGCEIGNSDLCFYMASTSATPNPLAAFSFIGNSLSAVEGFYIGGQTAQAGSLQILDSGVIGKAGAEFAQFYGGYSSLDDWGCTHGTGEAAPLPTPLMLSICYTGSRPALSANSLGFFNFSHGVTVDFYGRQTQYGVGGGIPVNSVSSFPSPSPTPFYITDYNNGNPVGTSGFRLVTTNSCFSATDTFLQMLAAGVSVFLVDCQGDVTFIGTITTTIAANSTVCTDGGGTLIACASPTPIPCPTAGTNMVISGTGLPNCSFSAVGSGGGFANLVCTAPVICSPSNGPTPSVAFSPTPEPCPTAGLGIAITGSFMPGCTITATGVAAPTSTPFDVVQLNDAPTHRWKLNDNGCVGSGGWVDDGTGTHFSFSTPSPIPSGLVCQDRPLINDGETSLFFPGTTTDYIQISAIVVPSASPSPAAWTFEAIMATAANTGTQTFWQQDNAVTTTGKYSCVTGNQLQANNGSATVFATTNGACVAGDWRLIDMECISPSTMVVYINAIRSFSGTFTCKNGPGAGPAAIAHDFGTTSNTWRGNMEKLAFYNLALTPTQVYNHYYAAKCGGNYVGTCSL